MTHSPCFTHRRRDGTHAMKNIASDAPSPPGRRRTLAMHMWEFCSPMMLS